MQITGAWDGSVTLLYSSNLSWYAAAAMFAEESAILPSEMRDSFDELVNLGGRSELAPAGNLRAFFTDDRGRRKSYNYRFRLCSRPASDLLLSWRTTGGDTFGKVLLSQSFAFIGVRRASFNNEYSFHRPFRVKISLSHVPFILPTRERRAL